jgi:hypothetical protein
LRRLSQRSRGSNEQFQVEALGRIASFDVMRTEKAFARFLAAHRAQVSAIGLIQRLLSA